MSAATNENGRGEPATFETTKQNRKRNAPAYSRQLLDARAKGLKLRTSLIVSLSWELGRAWPRIVCPPVLDVALTDFSCVHGLDCIVAHRSELGRALAVAAACLRAGAWPVVTLDAETGQTVYSAELAEIVVLGRAA